MSNKKSNNHYDNPNTETLISGMKAIFKRLRRISVSKYGTRKRILEKTGNWQQSPYIHSKVTLKSYLRICICYAIWVGENFPHVRSITYAYKAGCAHEYIQMCIDTGMSPYTIAQYRSALAKLYGVPGPMIHDNIPPRLSENVTKNRTYSYEDFLYALEINANNDIIWIAYMTGCRL